MSGLVRKGKVFRVFLFANIFFFFDCFQGSMTLCQSMRCSMPGRKTYNQIWPVLPSSGDIFFEVSASQVSDVIAFCPVLLRSTVVDTWVVNLFWMKKRSWTNTTINTIKLMNGWSRDSWVLYLGEVIQGGWFALWWLKVQSLQTKRRGYRLRTCNRPPETRWQRKLWPHSSWPHILG